MKKVVGGAYNPVSEYFMDGLRALGLANALLIMCGALYVSANIFVVRWWDLSAISPFLGIWFGHVVELPASFSLYPLVMLLSDIIALVYGGKFARGVVVVVALANLVVSLNFYLAHGWLPAAQFNVDDAKDFDRIFSVSLRIWAASFLSFFAGEFSNIAVITTQSRWINTMRKRIMASTIVGQGADSVVFYSLAFAFTKAGEHLLALILTAWITKCLWEFLFLPITPMIVEKIRKHARVS